MDKEETVKAVEEKVRECRGKSFEEWYYWKRKLEKLDPGNPLLDVGFRGKPYTGGCYS
jgi:hypothetical protein